MKTGFFRHAAAVLALAAAILSSGCSPQSAEPEPSEPGGSFVPLPAAETRMANIEFPAFDQKGLYDPLLQRLNGTLASAGQNVEIVVRYMQYSQGSSSDSQYLAAVKAELAAGNPSSDAYAFNFVDSGALFAEGLTMDVTDLVSQVAPVYHSKYKGIFPDRLAGVPVGIYSKPLWFKTALMLRRDYSEAGAGVTTLDALFKFADDEIVKPKKQVAITADPFILVQQWALERGYYDLNMFGVSGYYYAAVSDPACTPVALESIPGFDVFMTEMMPYYQNGSLSYDYGRGSAKEAVAMVRDLGEYYSSSTYSWLSQAEGDFSPHIMSPELPGFFIDPVYVNELAIPSVCDRERAVDVIRFVEWMYTGQGNYDAVVYGEKGVDFDGANGRYSPLQDGKPKQPKSYDELKSFFFAWPGANVLTNFDFFRMPACAPADIEKLEEDGIGQNLQFPAGAFIRTDRKSLDRMFRMSDEMKQAIQERIQAVFGVVYAEPADFTKEYLAVSLDKLAKCRSQWIADQYAAMLNGVRDSAEK